MRRFNPNPKTAARYEGTVRRKMVPGAMMCPQWTGRVNPQWQDLDKVGRARKSQVYTFWTDLFHPGVPWQFLDAALDRMEAQKKHFYIICTKRPERALEYFKARHWVGNDLARRLILMTTAENQEMADLRLPILLEIPGVMHGVSVEPGLGPVDFTKWISCYRPDVAKRKGEYRYIHLHRKTPPWTGSSAAAKPAVTPSPCTRIFPAG
jgi:protein gp37